MKFQKLTIHNIASIEDAVIDFEAQPLADSEVFLITGKTGAGKSTILDAICLALYAETPRLYDTLMQGNTKDGENNVKIDDPRQLMRRNTVEAFVSLTFIGSNGVHYEATWSVARAYKKLSGNLKSKDWQLKNLDEDYTLTRDKEVEAEIKTALGLDFRQFCRTTLLAQGEFTRFLNSKDDEKAEILEKITGVDIYSKIGAKVYAITGQNEQAWKDAQRLIDGITTLTEPEIEEKKRALSALDFQFTQIKASSDTCAAKRDWIKAETELTQGKNAAEEALKLAQEEVESKEFKEKETLIRDWNETINARAWQTEVQKAEAAKEIQRKALVALSANFETLLGGQKYAEEEAGKIETEIKEIEKLLSAEADKSDIYDHAQTIVGHLSTISTGRTAINKCSVMIDKENRTLKEVLFPAYEASKQAVKAAKELFDNEERTVRNQEEHLSQLNLPELRAQRDEAKELLGKVTTAKERLDTLDKAKKQYETTCKNLAEQKSAIEEKKKQAEEMNSPIKIAQATLDVRKEVLDKQKDTIDKFASTLRQRLHVGDTCPVCRQRIVTEMPHEDELSALVSELQTAYNFAEKEYKSLVDKKIKLDAEINTDSKAYEKAYKAFEEDKSVSNANQKAIDACKDCGFDKIDEDILQALTKLESDTRYKLSTLDSRIKEVETKEKEVKELRKALDSKRHRLETLASKVLEDEKAINDCKGRIATEEALIETKTNDVNNAGQKVAELVTTGEWTIDWKESPTDFAEALTAAAKEYNKNVQKKQTLMAIAETYKTNCTHVASVLTSIISVNPEWSAIKSSPAAKIDNLLEKANSIYQKVSIALNQLKNAEESYRINDSLLSEFLTEHDELTKERLYALNTYSSNDILQQDRELKIDLDTVVAKKTLAENARKLLEDHQDKKPPLTEDETLEMLNNQLADYEKMLNEIGEKKGAINQELKINQENTQRLSALIEDADKKKACYNKWSRLNQLIGDATGNKFCKIAQSYVLTSLIHTANSYMKTLSDRYTLKVTPGTFVILLEDAYQGFVTRAASTISGGESFLVSLSLALALSDIGQTLSVDTLFIDEGFGTLSGEPLQNAINTLRSLHSKAGRHVGIISHVEELQERIPVQIQVNQEGNNSCSRVRIIP